MVLAGVERKVWLGDLGVVGALDNVPGMGVCALMGAKTCFSGELLRLSIRAPVSRLCFDVDVESDVGAWKVEKVCAVPSSDANPLKVWCAGGNIAWKEGRRSSDSMCLRAVMLGLSNGLNSALVGDVKPNGSSSAAGLGFSGVI